MIEEHVEFWCCWVYDVLRVCCFNSEFEDYDVEQWIENLYSINENEVYIVNNYESKQWFWNIKNQK